VKDQHHLGFRMTYGVIGQKIVQDKATNVSPVGGTLWTARGKIIRRFRTVMAILVLLYGFELWMLKKKRQ